MNDIVKVEVQVYGLNHNIIGSVLRSNLFEFRNGMDTSLRVRMIQGQSKDTDFHTDQVAQIKEL